jgi:hypothetical protein
VFVEEERHDRTVVWNTTGPCIGESCPFIKNTLLHQSTAAEMLHYRHFFYGRRNVAQRKLFVFTVALIYIYLSFEYIVAFIIHWANHKCPHFVYRMLVS